MSPSESGDIPTNWPPDEGEAARRRLAGGGRPPIIVIVASTLFAVLLLGALGLIVSGKAGVASVADNEVAVKVNYLTGGKEVITTPGIKVYIPIAQEVFVFDKRSQEFTMEGREATSNNHVSRLTVRAGDGSNFWFDSLTVHYEIIPGDAEILLQDSGPGDAYKEEWIRAHARSILRDEFGRYSAVEVANPTVYNAAPIEAAKRLNEILASHGIRVTKIPVPDPKFDPEYEHAIETRKEADQEIQRLRAEEETIVEERGRRLASVEKEKEIERQDLEGDLQKELLASQEFAIQVKRGADATKIARVAEGEASKAEMLERARGLEAKFRKEAEGIAKQAEALEQRGEVVVREAIIEKLRQIRFTLVPYSRDPAPKRLEHTGAKPTMPLIDETSFTNGGRS
ncbi:MAG: SPFH domain-containing protein [Planctomycetota bacterium]|jgi:hypothetical protein|nr:SPFH domain-containing protein [Planctomycetota bacterium]